MLAAWDRDRALLPSCDTRCWRAELGMRHADLLREATAGIAKPASAPCMILQCGTWYGCVAAWPCGCVFGGGMGDAIGSKNTRKTFSTEFSTGSASRNSQSKKVESNTPFFNCVRKPDLGFSRKRPFSTDKSNCIRNGLSNKNPKPTCCIIRTYLVTACGMVQYNVFQRECPLAERCRLSRTKLVGQVHFFSRLDAFEMPITQLEYSWVSTQRLHNWNTPVLGGITWN